VPVAVDGTEFEVRLITLPDLNLRLMPPGPFEAGDAATLYTTGGAIAAGLRDIDEGPLEIRVERTAPLIDALSAHVSGPRIRLVHPGSYRIELCSNGRVLAGVTAEVAAPNRTSSQAASAFSESTRTATAEEASVLVAGSRISASIAVLRLERGDYEVLQGTVPDLEKSLWRYLSARAAAEEKVLICYPGLALSEVAGGLLSRLRAGLPQVSVAHLAYPAPRGGIATPAQARALLSHGVLCCAPANATIDRFDAYRCPRCAGRPILKTNASEIWQECMTCGYADHDLILTLSRFRASDVQVLFADFRIAKYLLRGRGRRYAGAFGQSVRCTQCNSPQRLFTRPAAWDAAELHRLLRVLAENWNSDNSGENLRRAAIVAARRSRHTRPGDVDELEERLRELVDCRVMTANGLVDSLKVQRLEAGLSLCCGKRLSWSKRQVASAALDLEHLVSPAIPMALHPDLSFGEVGVRQMLSLTD
jgi:hypothetical protein